jgi:hypothetical protein
MLSLGVVDPDIEIGNEVTLVWGEEGGGTKKDHRGSAHSGKPTNQKRLRQALVHGRETVAQHMTIRVCKLA